MSEMAKTPGQVAAIAYYREANNPSVAEFCEQRWEVCADRKYWEAAAQAVASPPPADVAVRELVEAAKAVLRLNSMFGREKEYVALRAALKHWKE